MRTHTGNICLKKEMRFLKTQDVGFAMLIADFFKQNRLENLFIGL
jgi:hypothetical protein